MGTSGCNLLMGPGATHVIYTVPSNLHLVVTNYEERTNVEVQDVYTQLLESGPGGDLFVNYTLTGYLAP